MNYSQMTIEELHQVIQNAQNEISLREAKGNGFFKEFTKDSKKAAFPCTGKQVEYAFALAKKTNSVIETSTSQLTKYFEMEEMSEAIDLMKEGKRIKIS